MREGYSKHCAVVIHSVGQTLDSALCGWQCSPTSWTYICDISYDLLSVSYIGFQTLMREWDPLATLHADAWHDSPTSLTYIGPRS